MLRVAGTGRRLAGARHPPTAVIKMRSVPQPVAARKRAADTNVLFLPLGQRWIIDHHRAVEILFDLRRPLFQNLDLHSSPPTQGWPHRAPAKRAPIQNSACDMSACSCRQAPCATPPNSPPRTPE